MWKIKAILNKELAYNDAGLDDHVEVLVKEEELDDPTVL
jgi:hypothetical protein